MTTYVFTKMDSTFVTFVIITDAELRNLKICAYMTYDIHMYSRNVRQFDYAYTLCAGTFYNSTKYFSRPTKLIFALKCVSRIHNIFLLRYLMRYMKT